MTSRNVPFDPPHEHLPEGGGNPSHLKHPKPLPAPLDVIAVVSNPVRYRSRTDLYRAFERYCGDSGARLTTVELAYGERPFEITDSANPRHVQLRTGHELWHKENLINLGIERLPRDWKYVAWVDADVRFARPDWVQETLHQLQHYDFVQMFDQALDLGPNHEPLKTHFGFVFSYLNGREPDARYENWHPGYAWAARREAIDAVGGLIDFAILGAGDRHMACALIGRVLDCYLPEVLAALHVSYRKLLALWEDRATQYIRKNIGYVPGLLTHYFHGAKRKRGYQDRWKILINNQFDPFADLKRDWQGVWQLCDDNLGLRDEIRRYFRSRDEDSPEL